ncbi:hypothetical protein [Methanolobus sp. WCC5]
MKTKKSIATLSPYLKKKLEQLSDKLGCSQAEVVRVAILKLAEEEL